LNTLPLHGILLIDVVTAMLAILPLTWVQVPQPPRKIAAGAPSSLWGDMRDGLRYVWSWPGLMLLGLMATVLNFLFNPAFSLTPILVTKHFAGQALQLAWMNSAWGVGIVVGGLTLGVWGGFRRRMVTSLAGLIGMGAATLFIGLAPATAFWLALSSMFAAGFMNVMCNGPLNAVFQSKVAPDMQGRVFMLIGSVTGAMSPLGMAIAGPVSDALGVRFWFVVAGTVCVLMGIAASFVPALMNLENTNGQVADEAVVPVAVTAE